MPRISQKNNHGSSNLLPQNLIYKNGSKDSKPNTASSSSSCDPFSPYKNALTKIKPLDDDDKEDFKTPIKIFTKMFKQAPPKKGKIKTKKSNKKISNPMIKRTNDNFKNCDVNAEHLQMALAMSKSTFEQEYPKQSLEDMEPDLPTFLSPNNIPKATSFLEKYGFTSKKSNLQEDFCENAMKFQEMKRKKNSKFRFVKPVLFLRTDKERETLIDSKVSQLLNEQKNVSRNFVTYSYNVNSTILKNYDGERKCWQMNCFNDFDAYICPSLDLSPTKAKVGYLLKDWNSIPGRDKSSNSDVNSVKTASNEVSTELKVKDQCLEKQSSEDKHAPFNIPIETSSGIYTKQIEQEKNACLDDQDNKMCNAEVETCFQEYSINQEPKSVYDSAGKLTFGAQGIENCVSPDLFDSDSDGEGSKSTIKSFSQNNLTEDSVVENPLDRSKDIRVFCKEKSNVSALKESPIKSRYFENSTGNFKISSLSKDTLQKIRSNLYRHSNGLREDIINEKPSGSLATKKSVSAIFNLSDESNSNDTLNMNSDEIINIDLSDDELPIKKISQKEILSLRQSHANLTSSEPVIQKYGVELVDFGSNVSSCNDKHQQISTTGEKIDSNDSNKQTQNKYNSTLCKIINENVSHDEPLKDLVNSSERFTSFSKEVPQEGILTLSQPHSDSNSAGPILHNYNKGIIDFDSGDLKSCSRDKLYVKSVKTDLSKQTKKENMSIFSKDEVINIDISDDESPGHLVNCNKNSTSAEEVSQKENLNFSQTRADFNSVKSILQKYGMELMDFESDVLRTSSCSDELHKNSNDRLKIGPNNEEFLHDSPTIDLISSNESFTSLAKELPRDGMLTNADSNSTELIPQKYDNGVMNFDSDVLRSFCKDKLHNKNVKTDLNDTSKQNQKKNKCIFSKDEINNIGLSDEESSRYLADCDENSTSSIEMVSQKKMLNSSQPCADLNSAELNLHTYNKETMDFYSDVLLPSCSDKLFENTSNKDKINVEQSNNELNTYGTNYSDDLTISDSSKQTKKKNYSTSCKNKVSVDLLDYDLSTNSSKDLKGVSINTSISLADLNSVESTVKKYSTEMTDFEVHADQSSDSESVDQSFNCRSSISLQTTARVNVYGDDLTKTSVSSNDSVNSKSDFSKKNNNPSKFRKRRTLNVDFLDCVTADTFKSTSGNSTESSLSQEKYQNTNPKDDFVLEDCKRNTCNKDVTQTINVSISVDSNDGFGQKVSEDEELIDLTQSSDDNTKVVRSKELIKEASVEPNLQCDVGRLDHSAKQYFRMKTYSRDSGNASCEYNSTKSLNITEYVLDVLNMEDDAAMANELKEDEDIPDTEYFSQSQNSCSQESIVVLSDEELNYSSKFSAQHHDFYNLTTFDECFSRGLESEDIDAVHSELKKKYSQQDTIQDKHKEKSEEKVEKSGLNLDKQEQEKNVSDKVSTSNNTESLTKPVADNYANVSTPDKNRKLNQNSYNAYNTPDENVIVKTNNITPMVDYDAMDSPQIRLELDKFGIKPLKRRRGIQLLKYIYDTTHPFVDVENLDTVSDEDNTRQAKRRRLSSKFEKVDSINIVGSDLIKSELESDLLFERKFGKKIMSCRIPLQIAWYNFLCCNQSISESIVLYEPIQLEVIHSMLKEQSGCNFHIEDLITFLDKKCITFRTNQWQASRKKVKAKS